jgi:hypothetical protein
MIYATGSTSNSVTVQIVDDSGLAVTGLVAATFPAVKYSLAGANASVSVSLSDLAAITTAWTSGGVKEREGGYYRLDLPDAAFASAGSVRVEGEASGKHLLCPELQIGGVGDVPATLGTPTDLNLSGATVAGNLQDVFSQAIGTHTDTAAILNAIPTNFGSLSIDTNGRVKIQSGVPKNTALAGFGFVMVLASDHVTGATGLTVTATRSIDGGAFAACTNAVTEVGSGVYKIDLSAADLNGNVVVLKFAAATADTRLIEVLTTP